VKVVIIGAVTICGRISPAGQGSPLDRSRLEGIRDETGASIMGANTLRTENPEMRGSGSIIQSKRIRAIITRSGNIPTEGKNLFSHGPPPVILSSEKNIRVIQKKLRDKAEVVALPTGPNGLSMTAVRDYFAGRGVDSLLIEGGAGLNYAALAENIVDEIFLTILPSVSGDMNETTFARGSVQLGDPFMKLELLSSQTVATGEVFLHYSVKKSG